MDREELELFRSSLERATASSTGKALDDALEELGWRDALDADRRAAVSTLFELQGIANATSSALDIVMAQAMGVEGPVVLPVLGSCAQPTDRGLGTFAFANSKPDGVLVRPVSGLDPSMELVEVSGESLPGEVEPASWAAAIAAGQVALGHELVGASKAMLSLAREHAVERIQFGRPIAAFQAVRHRLAESLVAIEGADAALDAAWDVESATTAALGKAIAGRSARSVARHCQQVLAGIGFTAEHPFHRYLRRTLVLDGLLGDARTLTWDLGEAMLRTRSIPAILPL
jgi:hypothetical protein